MIQRVPVYSSAQVRDAEKPLLAAGEPLMRRAAGGLARIAAAELGPAGGRVLVLAGAGDNGGDALFAAAHLAESAHIAVEVLRTSDRVHQAGLEAAMTAGARAVELAEVASGAADYDLVLDGILGIGASPSAALRGTARAAVEALLPLVRRGRPRVIAVDLPSGLQPDDGSRDDVVLPAAVTVTFGAVKAGLVVGRGPEVAGRIVLVDIGLGPGLANTDAVGDATVAVVAQG
jgi:NAD(P)H-hydrate epimerase